MSCTRRQYFKYTEEQKQFIRDHVKGTSDKDLAELFNKQYSTNRTAYHMHAFKINNHLKNGIDTKFKKNHDRGHRFKKGCQPQDTAPIGTLRNHRNCWWIKCRQYASATNDNWKQYHIFLWEIANKQKVPDGYFVMFLDGDRDHVCLENLILVPADEKMIADVRIGMTKNSELNKTILNLAKLQMTISKRQKSKNKDKQQHNDEQQNT